MSVKDPYLFDFLDVGEEAHERELETALVERITRFMLELGKGFAFVGRQYHLEVGGEDFGSNDMDAPTDCGITVPNWEGVINPE